MNDILKYIILIIIIFIIILINDKDKDKNKDKYVNYEPSKYDHNFKYEYPKPYKLDPNFKPCFTSFNGGNPMNNEMHVGEFYNNNNLLLLNNTNYKVHPSCCKTSGEFSTSSGCLCK